MDVKEIASGLRLIDPLIPRDEEDEFWAFLDAAVERLGLAVRVLLTAPWHKRSTAHVAERYGATVWAHRSDPAGLPAGVEVFAPRGVSEGLGVHA
jgi:hypothetical protein